jgi:hypothetical protein
VRIKELDRLDLDRQRALDFQRRIQRADDLEGQGRHRSAIEIAAGIRAEIGKLGAEGQLANRVLGTCYLLEARSYHGTGNAQAAFENYEEAEIRFRLDAENRDCLVRLLHDQALMLIEAGARSAGLQLLREARKESRQLSEKIFVEIDATYQHALAIDGDYKASSKAAERRIDELRERLKAPFHRGKSRIADEGALAVLLLNDGTATEWVEGQHLLLRALKAARRQRDFDLYAQGCRSMLTALRRSKPVFHGPLVREILHEGLGLAATLDALHQVDIAEASAAILYAGGVKARQGDALQLALLALTLREHQASRIKSTLIRGFRDESSDFGRWVALREAERASEADLFIELLEGSRLQVVPTAQVFTAVTDAKTDGQQRMSQIGRVELSPVQPLQVGTLSQLRERMPAAFEEAGDTIRLEDAISSVGGSRCIWWASTLIDSCLFWSVRSPEGKFAIGSHDLSDDDWGILSAALNGLRGAGRGSYVEALKVDPVAEEAISAQLGRILIPECLAQMLISNRASGTIPDLVIASNLVARLPGCLLGVRQASGAISRLIELATLRWAPPAAIVHKLSAPQVLAKRYPVEIAILDPDGTLPSAASANIEAEVILRNSNRVHANTGDVAATRVNLFLELFGKKLSRPAMLVFCGHSSSSAGGLTSAIQLEDGLLTAEDILFGSRAMGPLPMPARVLLSSCDSAGSSGQGAGEWLGLSAAMLLQGARQVVATGWPIADTPATGRFEEELVSKLIRSSDPALVLRESQLSRLAQWRNTDTGAAHSNSADVERPHAWAAFQVIGVRQ